MGEGRGKKVGRLGGEGGLEVGQARGVLVGGGGKVVREVGIGDREKQEKAAERGSKER